MSPPISRVLCRCRKEHCVVLSCKERQNRTHTHTQLAKNAKITLFYGKRSYRNHTSLCLAKLYREFFIPFIILKESCYGVIWVTFKKHPRKLLKGNER